MRKTLQTKYLRYSMDTAGHVLEFTDKASGINYAEPGSLFACLLPGVDVEFPEPIAPSSVAFNNDLITVRFDVPALSFTLRAREFDDNIRFTVVDCDAPSDYGRFVFAGCVLTDKNGVAPFSGSVLSLHLKCNLRELPGRQTVLGAMAYAKLGAIDAAAALVGAPRNEIGACLKAAFAHLTVVDIPMNPKGGPYGAGIPESHNDYMIIAKPDFDHIDEWLKPFEIARITQLDLHKGVVYRQGDFEFDRALLPAGVEEFRRRFSDALHARGMLAGLHTYSAMVNHLSRFVTPVPDPDLRCLCAYTLADDIDAAANRMPILENTKDVPLAQFHSTRNATCVVIDDELIEFSGVDAVSLTGCARGARGSIARAHKKGAVVRHLLCLYNEFQATPGSPLFFRVAEAMADVFNAGDFDMMYFDGLECIGKSCLPEQQGLYWHYEAMFVREVLRRVRKAPLVEYSIIHPLLWTARSRAGAFDSPTSAYKHFIDLHCADNEQKAHRRLLPSQLGWYHLYPALRNADPIGAGDSPLPANWHFKYSYEDDTDYLGVKSIAYDSGLSFGHVPPETAAGFPVYQRYVKRVALYSRLRHERFFSHAVREQLKPAKTGFRLISVNGKYGFERLERLVARPLSLQAGENTARIVNPFAAQYPTVRLIAQCGGEDYDAPSARAIARFDRSMPAVEQQRVFEYPGDSLDLSGHEALGIWVKGNNKEEYLTVRLQGMNAPGTGISEHIVPLNFDGWRCFTLCESDNEDFPEITFGDTTPNIYARFRNAVFYSHLGRISVLFSGAGDGVFLGDLRAMPLRNEPIVNPSVTIGGQTLAFDCDLAPGHYLEYAPGAAQAISYDVHGRETRIPATGAIGMLPAGESSVMVAGGARGAFRAKLHLLVVGARIFNE